MSFLPYCVRACDRRQSSTPLPIPPPAAAARSLPYPVQPSAYHFHEACVIDHGIYAGKQFLHAVYPYCQPAHSSTDHRCLWMPYRIAFVLLVTNRLPLPPPAPPPPAPPLPPPPFARSLPRSVQPRALRLHVACTIDHGAAAPTVFDTMRTVESAGWVTWESPMPRNAVTPWWPFRGATARGRYLLNSE